MGKWTRAAKALKEKLNKREALATDMDVILSRISQLPPGQLKKVLDEETITIFRKHDIDL